MNLSFGGTIARLSPPDTPAYDPSRWRVKLLPGEAVILDDLPPIGMPGGVAVRRIAVVKATPYIGEAEAEYIAKRIVEACRADQQSRQAMKSAETEMRGFDDLHA